MRGLPLLLAVACTGDDARAPAPRASAVEVPIAASSTPSTTATADASLPPLRAAWLEKLPLEGFADASVAVPIGATEPRPVVVGVHGRGDRPEWACGEWRGITRAYAFVVCPHGTPKDAPPGAGLAFADAATTAREIDAAVAATRARFGAHVADGPMIYAGFSLGAILGARIVADDPARFPVVILAEGGTARIVENAARFAAGGGQRVLLFCSTAACEATARPAVVALERAGLEARFATAGNVGHLVDQRIIDALVPEVPWVVAGDARWRGLPR